MDHFWNDTAKDYDLRHETPRMKHLRRQEFKAVEKFAEGRILDLGCGTGFPLAPLEKSGNEVYGIDYSLKSLKILKDKIPKAKLVLGDCLHLPFKKNTFDTIVSTLSPINYVEETHEMLNELKRVSRKGSLAIFSMAGNWDKGLSERNDLKHLKRRKLMRIHGYKTKTIIFGSEYIVREFERVGFKIKYLEGVFLFIDIKWGNFKPLSLKEKLLLFIEKIFSKRFEGRVHIMVFQKT